MIFFVKRFSKLYGEQNLTFKLHCQVHLIKQVKEFAPLHRYSFLTATNDTSKATVPPRMQLIESKVTAGYTKGFFMVLSHLLSRRFK